MNRRKFLSAIAGIPVVALTKPSASSAGAPTPEGWHPPEGATGVLFSNAPLEEVEGAATPRPQLGWMEMAEKLNANLDAYIATDEAKHGVKWDEIEVGHQKAICYRMCRALLDDSPWVEEVSQLFYPDQPLDMIKNVCFDVSDGPIAVIANPKTCKQEVKPCQPRRLKLKYNPNVYEDLLAYHGIDVEAEMIAAAGQEVALEIACEIRGALKHNNERIHTYSIYLPPFMGPANYPWTPKDFSINRGFRMRYARFF